MSSLDRACVRAILGGIGVAVIAGAGLRVCGALDVGAPDVALRFLAFALLTWLLVATILWRARTGAGTASLGISSHVTLLRGLLVSLVAGFVLVPPGGRFRWLPGLLYTMAALSDRYDGVLARRLGQVSAFGARLDVAMDGLGLLVAPVVAVVWRRLPPWYLLVGAAYYLFHGGIAVRRRWGLPVHIDRLRPSRTTRLFAGLQMTLVSVALFPVIGLRTTAIAATLLMLPTLAFFVRDWLVVTGRGLGDRVVPEESLAR